MTKIIGISLLAILIGIVGGILYNQYFEQPALFGAVTSSIQEDNPTGMANPTNGAATPSTATGLAKGTMSAGTYYFRLASVDYAGGQNVPQPQFTCVVADSNATSSCVVTFTPVTGAAYTYLWVGTSTGVYYSYISTATSSTNVATTSSHTAGRMKQVSSAYYYNSGVNFPNTFLKSYVTTNSLIKSGSTFVHSITYSPSDAAATAGYIEILDNTVPGTGTTTMYSPPAAAIAPVTVILDQVFSTGLYVHFITTADVNVSVSYK